MFPSCLGSSLISKTQHKTWHAVGVQSISAELMYGFNKQMHEFLLESTLALSLCWATFPDSFTFCDQSCLFYKQYSWGGWGGVGGSLNPLTSQQAKDSCHIQAYSKGDFPIYQGGPAAPDIQVTFLFLNQTEVNLLPL